jgi:hypothetical protein
MHRVTRRPRFQADVVNQFSWYFLEASEEVAWKFEAAVKETVVRLMENPTVGRIRHFKDPRLQNLRSFQVNTPFDRFLIFYRIEDGTLTMERLIEGSRLLSRRLLD